MKDWLSGGQFQKVKPRKPTAIGQPPVHCQSLSPQACWQCGQVPLGHPMGESDLFLRTSELARFGKLLLDDGCHEGRQLVPAGYSARIAAESVPTVNYPGDEGFRLAPRYGLGAWCGPGDGTFSMLGRYGQFCIVSPPREAVVTITAHAEGGSPGPSITTLVTEELVNRL